MESEVLLEKVCRMIALLEEIAQNTRPENIEEPKSRIRGFSGDDLNGGDQL